MVTIDQLATGLSDVTRSPNDGGTLECIVVRPTGGAREHRTSARLSAEHGIDGDRWRTSCWLKLPDGSPDPRVQLSLMNARILRLVAGNEDRMALAGDNLIVDFDLSASNLVAGQRLAIGEAIVEVTDVPHTGCAKFMNRYGKDAVKFINSAQGKRLHLRGWYAKVVTPGVVRVGDTVHKA